MRRELDGHLRSSRVTTSALHTRPADHLVSVPQGPLAVIIDARLLASPTASCVHNPVTRPANARRTSLVIKRTEFDKLTWSIYRRFAASSARTSRRL